MRKSVLLVVKIAVGVAIFAFLLSKIHVADSIALLKEAIPGYVVMAVVCTFLANFLLVARWKVILDVTVFRLSFWRLAAVNFVGIFFSSFLPGSVGGDVLKVFYLVDPRQSGQAMTATVLSRLVGMVAAFIIGLGAMPFASPVFSGESWWPLCGIALAFAAAGTSALLLPTVDRFLPGLLARVHAPRKHVELATSLVAPIAAWRSRRGAAAVTMVLAFLYQIVGPVFVLYFSALALGARLPLASVTMVAAIANVAFALPISLNGLGVAEGVYVYLFVLLGLTPERAFLLALLFRVVFTLQAVVGGVLYFFIQRRHTTPVAPAGESR